MLRFLPARFAFFVLFTGLFGRSFPGAEFEDYEHPCWRESRARRRAAGTTPFEKTFPGGYFHRAHTVIGQRLEHPMVARVSLAGYATHEIALTEGPCSGSTFTDAVTGQYWLFNKFAAKRVWDAPL